MKRFLRRLWSCEEGAEVVEWVAIVSILAAVAFAAYALLGDQVNAALNDVGSTLRSPLNG